METKKVDTNSKKLLFVYYVMYFIAVLSALLGYYLTMKGQLYVHPQSSTGITLTSVFILYIIGSIPLTLGGFHMMTKKWIALESVEEKVDRYTKAAIIRLIMIGVSVAIGVFLFYITHSQSMIFCAGIAAIALFFCKPSAAKIISELQLEDTED